MVRCRRNREMFRAKKADDSHCVVVDVVVDADDEGVEKVEESLGSCIRHDDLMIGEVQQGPRSSSSLSSSPSRL